MLLVGWLSAFLLGSTPQSSTFYVLVPTFFLGVGMGVVLKAVSRKLMALTLVLTALMAVILTNQFYPGSTISLSAFQNRLQENIERGKIIPVIVRDTDRVGIFAEPHVLEAFADVKIHLFTRLPGPARMMTFDPAGNLYVSIPMLGAVYLLRDTDNDGFADQPILYHVGMDRPHGLVWSDGHLYVAETGNVLELKDTNQDAQVDEVRIVLDDLPDDGGHWTRTLARGKDGLLYLSVGSQCNACEEKDPRRATVLRVNPITGESSIFARGLRNTVGLAFSPDGQTLWGSDNGRDNLGDQLPPDEINQINEGGDYGWPYCYGDQVPDPQLGSSERCRETLPSFVNLPAHSAPLGITFGDGLSAPEEYVDSLYVAFHGSWNRSEPTGYKLARVAHQNQQMSNVGKEFLRGWMINGEIWGRPVAPIVGPDGNLYLSDDRADAIYQISWIK